MNFVEYQKFVEYKKTKGKNVIKLAIQYINKYQVSLREKEAYNNK